MLDARMLHSIKVLSRSFNKGSSEKKKRNPLTKLAVDSIDADCNGPVSFELRRAANSLRE
ncbi:hypothetical protein BOX15_Mlig009740g1 [Macrostomum lignano]|uniref:Uncharacterized protein n=1 Tax=Macrostomum lignano TaxID=282301 RepID=A0A267DBT3_9PLAT|nr:hypothetical protein BOX15_Mlig009740g3 [Macrostomum lignano]PAA57082.1 hypothetical protein BOX15_Mlig009740g1 [Macrostomum lignano]